MDPLATLARLRELAAEILDVSPLTGQEAAEEFAQLFQALDEWRGRGGFDPWERERFHGERRR